jgi:hypothetical protein
MTNVLPQQLGLTVSGVIYRYGTEKVTEDDMLVHIQNENARGPGYIFRETDDWSGLAGNTITKAVAVPMIDISYWGIGSIEVEGTGTVVDAEVIYTYQYTPCKDPQSDPTCPGYIDPTAAALVDLAIFDTSGEEYIQDELDRKANIKAQKEEEERAERKRFIEAKKEEIEENLEELLGMVNTDLLNEQSKALHAALALTNYLPQAYLVEINGGKYPEALKLKDKNLSDNKKAARVGLAQQVLHDKIVQSQYD